MAGELLSDNEHDIVSVFHSFIFSHHGYVSRNTFGIVSSSLLVTLTQKHQFNLSVKSVQFMPCYLLFLFSVFPIKSWVYRCIMSKNTYYISLKQY
jgi:hypothetical protein